MKKTLFLAAALLVSSNTFAVTDHYLLRDGDDVQHLKITTIGKEITVSADVDFEPSAGEEGRKACSAEISGEAKLVAENELVLKKHIEGEARHCVIKVHLTANGAKLEQSDECSHYAAGICHFTSTKELIKIK